MEMRWAASHLYMCLFNEFKFRLIRFEDQVEAFPMLGSIALWAIVRKMTFLEESGDTVIVLFECMEVVNCVLLAAAAKTDRRL